MRDEFSADRGQGVGARGRVIPMHSDSGTAVVRLSFAGIPSEDMRDGVEMFHDIVLGETD